MGAKGQSAVEYLLVFSTVLVVFASVTFASMLNPAQEEGKNTLYLSQGRVAADAIAGAINSVYANGRGAVKTVSFTMGCSWDLELDNVTKNLKIIVLGNEIRNNLWYDIDNYHSLSKIDAGTYTVIVEWPEAETIPEQIDSSAIENDKIFIYIKPRGR